MSGPPGDVPAGGGQQHVFRGGQSALTVGITGPPLRFAPSVETLTVRYTVTDTASAATAARLVIKDRAGAVQAQIDSIPFAAGAHTATWDGQINQGANAGTYIGPAASPLSVLVQLNPGASAVSSAPLAVSVEVESITVERTPAQAVNPLRIYKPSAAATDTDQEAKAVVKLRNAAGTGVVTQVPIRVDWTFQDEPANCPLAKGGKDNTSTHFRAAAGHPASGSVLTASTTTDVHGESRIVFLASVIGGDKFTVRASVLQAPGGTVLAHGDSARFEVWKKLHYTNLFQMQSGGHTGVDVDALCTVAHMQPSYTPAFTEYDKGPAHLVAYREHISTLKLPTAAQLPAKSKVSITSDGPDTRQVTVIGLLVNADGSTHAGQEVLTLNGTTAVHGASDFQKVDRVTLSADPARTVVVDEDGGARRRVSTIASHLVRAAPAFLFDTDANVQTKAQAWVDANENALGTDLRSFDNTLGVANYHLVGCGWYHPKHDGGHTPDTTYYAGYPAVRIAVGDAPNLEHLRPDGQWPSYDGVNQGHLSCLFMNMDAGNTSVVAAHEIGHSSDHVTYGTGDHCPQSSATCLMNYESQHLHFCTAGTDNSRKRTWGWNTP